MFRKFVGGFCVLVGAVFLTINSIILWRGAAKWASEDVEWWAFGLAAALVPWVVGIMPAIMADCWRPVLVTRWGTISRPSITVVLVWTAFILYNIVGGSGAIGFNRQELMAKREHGADVLTGLKDQRAAKQQELSGIPASRPAESIELEADALRQRREYRDSGNCQNRKKSKNERELCEKLLRLESEAAAADAAARVRKEIAALDERIAGTDPSTTTAAVDPQAALIADVTPFTEAQIKRWLPAATPVILEIGAATMWHFGFLILGLGLAGHTRAQEAPAKVVGYIPSPEAARRSEAPLEALTAQRRLCEYFWRECVRPVASGALTEAEWFEHYTLVCRRSNDSPLPVESFRRIAMRFVPRIQFIDGQYLYYEVLPKIPENAV